MNTPAFRQGLLLVITMILVFVFARGGILQVPWNDLLGGIAISVLATLTSLYFMQELNKRSINFKEIKQTIVEGLREQKHLHFGRVDRNIDMGEEYWLGCIADLDTSRDPAWFMGTRLERWRLRTTYSVTLRSKLLKRFKLACNKRPVPGHNDDYMTYIILADEVAMSGWKAFFQDIINELTQSQNSLRKEHLQRQYWSKVFVAVFPKDLIKYSLVLCGERLAVTHYTSTGQLEDSPTLDIKPESVVRRLYMDDLKRLAASKPSIAVVP